MRPAASLLALPVVVIAISTVLAGCSRDQSVICNNRVAYQQAGDAGQLRIPDDLSIPDEIDALRIPGQASAGQGSLPGEDTPIDSCLELSPAFVVGPDPESDSER